MPSWRNDYSGRQKNKTPRFVYGTARVGDLVRPDAEYIRIYPEEFQYYHYYEVIDVDSGGGVGVIGYHRARSWIPFGRYSIVRRANGRTERQGR